MKQISSPIIIHSSRLTLQPVSNEFKLDICGEFTLEITRYMPFTPTNDIKETEDFIAHAADELINGKAIHFCILKTGMSEFMGCGALDHIDSGAVEIGLWLKKSVHGNGYGTETVKALMDFAEQNIDFDYLFYPVDKNNHASRRIPEKLGFFVAASYEKKKNETDILHVVEYRKDKYGGDNYGQIRTFAYNCCKNHSMKSRCFS